MELSKVGFIQTSVAKYNNKLGKGIHKRKYVEGGRKAIVGARLTAEQRAKLESLVNHSTKLTGVQATVSSVIAELIDTAKCSVITSELS
jgi:hypothetical protein